MFRSTHGKGRDDPELVRFVAQPTGKRSHVSENVRVRSTPCVVTRWSFSPVYDCPKALRQQQTGYVAPYLNNLTQRWRGTESSAITERPGRWTATNTSLGTHRMRGGPRTDWRTANIGLNNPGGEEQLTTQPTSYQPVPIPQVQCG